MKVEDQEDHLQNVMIPVKIRGLQAENERLKEEIENATNRQLRRTLIFRNIAETKDVEAHPKADTISSYTDITHKEVLEGIKWAHR